MTNHFPSSLFDHVTDGVYISGWRASAYPQMLRDAGIRHVLVVKQYPVVFPDDFEICVNGVDDGAFIPSETLQRGVEFVNAQVSAGNPVLVMCSMGISRSSTFVLAYLIEKGYTLREAFDLLKRQHPQAEPNREMWRSLIEHYHLPDTVDHALHWANDNQTSDSSKRL